MFFDGGTPIFYGHRTQFRSSTKHLLVKMRFYTTLFPYKIIMSCSSYEYFMLDYPPCYKCWLIAVGVAAWRCMQGLGTCINNLAVFFFII